MTIKHNLTNKLKNGAIMLGEKKKPIFSLFQVTGSRKSYTRLQ
jgi:hypothetical protein